MTDDGWAGDPSRQPWWMFFILFAACVAVSAIFTGLYESTSASSATLARLVVLPVAVGTLVFGIERTLRWMYGPNLGRAEHGPGALTDSELSGIDEVPARQRRSQVAGFNAAVIGCLLALAALIVFTYR